MTERLTMIIRAITLALVTLIASPVLAYNGVISIETVDALPGDHVPVQVLLSSNDVDIAGISIPLHWTSTHLTLDSVSFLGALSSTSVSGFANVYNDQKKADIYYLPSVSETSISPINDLEGNLATLWFSVGISAPALTLVIDSVNETVNLGGGIQITTRVEVTDTSGLTVLSPEFVSGGIVVQSPTGVDDGDELLPQAFSLKQNYPNPFNPTTSIEYTLPRAAEARLTVYNLLGQEVITLATGWQEAGEHSVEFDAGSLPSGVYFYRLSAGSQVETKKMVLVK